MFITFVPMSAICRLSQYKNKIVLYILSNAFFVSSLLSLLKKYAILSFTVKIQMFIPIPMIHFIPDHFFHSYFPKQKTTLNCKPKRKVGKGKIEEELRKSRGKEMYNLIGKHLRAICSLVLVVSVRFGQKGSHVDNLAIERHVIDALNGLFGRFMGLKVNKAVALGAVLIAHYFARNNVAKG
ncbi:hypothetical protein BpHYR1_025749 [Brachionus plicatilis]|uniref:Uncharacterized protein n=1 Tax=Brachionus plicatilis TaxID=10195 RepID=A0A3M7RP03_BRAPC|nr:hypothetical protein BpHYR1_025749 [Brachionus plicatilis]